MQLGQLTVSGVKLSCLVHGCNEILHNEQDQRALAKMRAVNNQGRTVMLLTRCEGVLCHFDRLRRASLSFSYLTADSHAVSATDLSLAFKHLLAYRTY
jgi:hypothetical protein